MSSIIKNLTDIDKATLEAIKAEYQNEDIPIELSGKILLANDRIVSSWRAFRLMVLKKLIPNNDGLIDGFSQTCTLAKDDLYARRYD
jgi:hypothetical protein